MNDFIPDGNLHQLQGGGPWQGSVKAMGIDGLATFGEGQQKPRAVLADFRDLQRKPAAVQVGTQGGHCVVAGLGRAQPSGGALV